MNFSSLNAAVVTVPPATPTSLHPPKECGWLIPLQDYIPFVFFLVYLTMFIHNRFWWHVLSIARWKTAFDLAVKLHAAVFCTVVFFSGIWCLKDVTNYRITVLISMLASWFTMFINRGPIMWITIGCTDLCLISLITINCVLSTDPLLFLNFLPWVVSIFLQTFVQLFIVRPLADELGIVIHAEPLLPVHHVSEEERM
jgi:hypothetical protein